MRRNGRERRADIDGNHDIGAHGSHDIDWDLVDQAAVDQNAAINGDRIECTRNRHARPHGFGQTAGIQNDGFAGVDVGRHRTIGNRKTVEIGHARRSRNLALEEQLDIFTGQ